MTNGMLAQAYESLGAYSNEIGDREQSLCELICYEAGMTCQLDARKDR